MIESESLPLSQWQTGALALAAVQIFKLKPRRLGGAARGRGGSGCGMRPGPDAAPGPAAAGGGPPGPPSRSKAARTTRRPRASLSEHAGPGPVPAGTRRRACKAAQPEARASALGLTGK